MSDWKPQSTDHFQRAGTTVDYEAGYHRGFSEGCELGVKAVIERIETETRSIVYLELAETLRKEAGLDD